ncbi:MAG: class I SAM-dependent RNA methyltransferase [Brevinematia bacterium]
MEELNISFKPRKIKSTKREIVLKIEKIANEGCSIGYENEKVIFVRYAIPGEVIKANVYRETSSYAMAEPLEILEPSPIRIKPPCPYFSICGGCDYEMLPYEKQLQIKTELVSETFKKIGGIEIEKIVDVIESPLKFNYRNTETFKVDPKNKKIGFFRKDTKFVVDIEKCALAMPKINEALSEIRKQNDFPPHNFKVRTTNDGDVVVNFIRTERFEDRPVYETLKALGKEIKFKISKDSFFQVNNSIIPLWLEKIASFLDSDGHEKIYDLYCGIGLITVFVSFFAKKTVGIEIAKSSVKDALHNLEKNNISTDITFINAPVEEKLKELDAADVFIIDPPRKGMDNKCISILKELKPEKIIYSSCKPSTMARDIGLLKDLYKIEKLSVVDMFPQTHHVETLALLIRK